MLRRFQDEMAVVRHYGKPDLFITFTCNPTWTEITEALLPEKKPLDRPDIQSQVFKLKIKALIKELYKDGICGSQVAFVYVIEYQKRGLSHAHIHVWLADERKLKTTEDLDTIICAELPNVS